jgi:ABC-type glycerol-3-phosphate transport system substrate-binding protein
MMDPERIWPILQQQTGSTGDTIDLSKIPASVRNVSKMMAERTGTAPLPESGIMTKEEFITFATRNAAIASSGGGRDMGGRDMGGRDMGGRDTGAWGGNYGGFDNQRNERKDAEEAKPIAMRYGKLPKDLPDWFDSDDLNRDGQIAMHEWLKANKSIDEFNLMDLNGDGLITADELLRFRRQQDEAQRTAAILDGGSAPRPTGMAGPGGRGRGPGGPAGAPAPSGISLPGSTPDASPASSDRSPRGGGPNPFQTGGRMGKR